MSDHVFVSGGSGYIAGFLIRQLVSEGWTVHTTVRSLAKEAAVRALLQDELVRISKQTRKTMILITHSIEEAIKLSDRIIVMTLTPRNFPTNHTRQRRFQGAWTTQHLK